MQSASFDALTMLSGYRANKNCVETRDVSRVGPCYFGKQKVFFFFCGFCFYYLWLESIYQVVCGF